MARPDSPGPARHDLTGMAPPGMARPARHGLTGPHGPAMPGRAMPPLSYRLRGSPWHCLNFFPEPHGHGAFRPTRE
jgi:hypothetical protein